MKIESRLKIKSALFFAGSFAVSFFFCQFAVAGNYFVPAHQDLRSITIENRTQQAEMIWTQVAITSVHSPEERSYEIPPQSHISIPLSEFQLAPWLVIKTRSDLLKINLGFQTSLGTQKVLRVFKGESDTLSFTSAAPELGELTLTSLSPIDHDGQILISSPSRKSKIAFSLKAFQQLKLNLRVGPGDLIKVIGKYSLSAYWKTKKSLVLLKSLPSESPKQPNSLKTYFVVSNPNRTQSFVIALEDPELIRKARALLAQPNEILEKIVAAKISMGSDSINRNFASPLQNPWSWTVQVSQFVSAGSTQCNGNPQDLEDYLIPWFQYKPFICFWNYTVTEELVNIADRVRPD